MMLFSENPAELQKLAKGLTEKLPKVPGAEMRKPLTIAPLIHVFMRWRHSHNS